MTILTVLQWFLSALFIALLIVMALGPLWIERGSRRH